MEGYHSPQVDVDVRLNTNESPVPPPAAFARRAGRRAGRRRLAPLPRPRRRRAAGRASASSTASSPSRSSRPTAPTRCSRRSASPTAAPGRTVAVFEPTYALHSHIARITGTDGGRGRARRRLRPRPRRGRPGARRAAPGDHVPLLAQQPDRAGRAARTVVEAVLERGARAASSSTRPTASSPRGRRSTLVDDDAPLVVTRTFSKTWSMAGRPPRLPASARRGWSPSSRRSCCRTTSTRSSRSPARLALDFTRRDGGAGRRRSSRSGAGWRPRSADLAVDVWPSGANFVLFRPRRTRRATRCGRRCSTARSSSATARRGPASTAACGSPIGTPDEDDAFLAALEEVLGMSRETVGDASADDQGDRRSTSRSTSTAPGTVDGRRPACRSSTTCSTSSAATAASTSTVEADGRPRTSTATTPSRTSASSSARPSREALGDKAGVRRFASGLFPLDEALVEVALDLSGRPFVVYDVPFGEVLPLGDPPFDPEMAEHFWQSFATAAGITLHVHQAARAQHPPRRRGHLQGRGPLPARRRAGRGRRRPVHQGHAVTERRPLDRRARLRHRQPALGPEGAERVGADARLTADPGLIADAAGVVLPGVGAFGRCMEALRATGPRPTSPSRRPTSGRPFLGICVGMQLLYEGSDETPGVAGPRRPARADASGCPTGVKRPQMQWNALDVRRPTPAARRARRPGVDVLRALLRAPRTRADVVATCDYGGPVVAAVERGNVWATQFHPEKSGAERPAHPGQLRRALRRRSERDGPVSRRSTCAAGGACA